MIILDSNIVSSLLDPKDATHEAAALAYRQSESAGASFGISVITWSETMVHALNQGQDALDSLTALLSRVTDEWFDVDTSVAKYAARLRAGNRGLRLRDALILATAREQPDGILLTADQALAKKAPDGLVELVTA